jgi:hypothetical protein
MHTPPVRHAYNKAARTRVGCAREAVGGRCGQSRESADDTYRDVLVDERCTSLGDQMRLAPCKQLLPREVSGDGRTRHGGFGVSKRAMRCEMVRTEAPRVTLDQSTNGRKRAARDLHGLILFSLCVPVEKEEACTVRDDGGNLSHPKPEGYLSCACPLNTRRGGNTHGIIRFAPSAPPALGNSSRRLTCRSKNREYLRTSVWVCQKRLRPQP